MENATTTGRTQGELSATEQSLFTFFRLSYLHSQGDETTQIKIFLWASKKGLLDELEVPTSITNYIYDSIVPPTNHMNAWRQPYAIIYPFRALIGAAHGYLPDQINGYKNRAENQERIFNASKRMSPEMLLCKILMDIVEKDIMYQQKQREGRTNPTSDNGMNDPHASFFRRCVLQQRGPGHPIYEAMYQEARQLLESYQRKGNIISRPNVFFRNKLIARNLKKLAKRWEQNHPGQHFYSE